MEKMATMTLNEFVNKLDQPLWEQLIVADKRPGMAITMYALHDIWVDVLIQTLDSDEWQIRKGEDLTKPPSISVVSITTDLKTRGSAGSSSIPKAPAGTKPILSSTEPSPGASPSKIPRRSKKTPITSLEVLPEPIPKPSPKPLPKVIPKPSLFRKRRLSLESSPPGRKRSRSLGGQSSTKSRSRPVEAIPSSKKRTPPPDDLLAGGGVRERIRTPYGGTLVSDSQNVPRVTVLEKERHETKEDVKSPRSVSPSSGGKRASSSEAQDETKKHVKKPQPGLSEARSSTTLVIPELRERPRVPYSWKPGEPLKTKPSKQAGSEPTRRVSEASPEKEQNSVKPKQPERFEQGPPTPYWKDYEVRPILPTLGPKQREENVKKSKPEADTDVKFQESKGAASCARGFGKEAPEPIPYPVGEEDAAQVKPEPQPEDSSDPLQVRSRESTTTGPKPSTDPASDSNHIPSHVKDDEPALENPKPKRSKSSKPISRRSKQNFEIRRDSQTRTSLGPIPASRPVSHWVSYYHQPTASYQDPFWGTSELWAYFRSLLRVNDEEIYSSTGPDNPSFQPLPAPQPAPVGEPGPLVPYHELPERLQPKPVAGTGFVTPTTPFRVGFVTSILNPKVLRQRCLGRQGGGAEEEGKAGFDDGKYAERSKICYPTPLGVEVMSNDSRDERREGDTHRRQGQEATQPEVVVEGVTDGRPDFERFGQGRSEADEPGTSDAIAGRSHTSMAETELSESESTGAYIPIFDYERDQEHETTEPGMHESMSPTAYAEPIGDISHDELAISTGAENHEVARSEVDESQAGGMKAERAKSDYSESEGSGAESSGLERYDAENLVIDEYGDDDEDHKYRPVGFNGEEYEVELEEAEHG
jgi:hypothetical protein